MHDQMRKFAKLNLLVVSMSLKNDEKKFTTIYPTLPFAKDSK